jgi:HTH-type transcriptional regulator/antitoxin HigA
MRTQRSSIDDAPGTNSPPRKWRREKVSFLSFSFFHEAAHILYGPKTECFLDDGESEDAAEAQANRFAQNFLIPPERAKELPGLKTADQVKAFAASIGIAPGVVVGRLQREKGIEYNQWNGLKQRFEWAKDNQAQV